MLLRLDPAIPLLWRDPTTLQFGVDPVTAVVPDVSPALERLVAVLAAGVSESGYQMLASTYGVSDGQAAALRVTLAGCLLGPTPEPTAARAAVLGGTPLAHAIARILGELGLRADHPEQADVVVLVGDRVIAPAEHRGLLQRDVPHFAVTASDASITIGHLVEPGTTACLHCLDLHRRDVDPAWSAIGAQLAMLAPPPPHPLRTAVAATEAARVVARRLADGPDTRAIERRVTGDGRVDQISERLVEPHPECRCAAPPESDWAPGDESATPRPTTTATASAAHA